jgi:hypothetical protein
MEPASTGVFPLSLPLARTVHSAILIIVTSTAVEIVTSVVGSLAPIPRIAPIIVVIIVRVVVIVAIIVIGIIVTIITPIVMIAGITRRLNRFVNSPMLILRSHYRGWIEGKYQNSPQ